MSKRNLIIVGGVIAFLVLAPIAWWLVSPLWRTDVVDEAFPFDVPTVSEAEEMVAEGPAGADKLEAQLVEVMEKASDMKDEMTDEEMAEVSEQLQEVAAVMPDKEMEEEMPEPAASANEWVQVSTGTISGADDFHQGSGTAAIFQQGDTRILRLEDFMVTNGPDLHVLLVENADDGDMGEYYDLGKLKGNVGAQNYDIPAEVDLSQFNGVMIYCQPFHVNFATAPWN